MAKMDGELTVSWGFRPCFVENRKAVFHMWHPSGQLIVEYESGVFDLVPLEKVTMADSEKMFKEFSWKKI